MSDERSRKIHHTSESLVALTAAIRASRAFLGWSQKELSNRSGVSVPSINRMERMERTPKLETLWRLEKAIEAAGVTFRSRDSGDYALEIEGRVVEELMERLAAGKGITSRGKISRSEGDAGGGSVGGG